MTNQSDEFPELGEEQPPTKKKFLRNLIIAAVPLLLIAGLGAILATWYFKPKTEKPVAQTHNAPSPKATPATDPAAGILADEIPMLPPDITSGTGIAPDNKVQLYFTSDGYRLQSQVIELSKSMTVQEKLKFALEELFQGPSSADMKSAVPEGVQLRAAFVKEGTAVIDLSSAIQKPLGGVTAEILCAYAIVDTIASSIGGVTNVSILVEGNSPSVLWHTVDLTAPLSPDFSIAKK